MVFNFFIILENSGVWVYNAKCIRICRKWDYYINKKYMAILLIINTDEETFQKLRKMRNERKTGFLNNVTKSDTTSGYTGARPEK